MHVTLWFPWDASLIKSMLLFFACVWWFQSSRGLSEASLLMFVSGMSQYTNPYAVLLNKIEHHYYNSSWIINRCFIWNTVPVSISFCSSISGPLSECCCVHMQKLKNSCDLLSIHFRAVHSQYKFVFSLEVLSEEVTKRNLLVCNTI